MLAVPNGRACAVEGLSNHIHVLLPVWMGATTRRGTTRAPRTGREQSAAPVRVWAARGEDVVPIFVEQRGEGPPGRLDALLALGDEPALPTAIPAGTRLLGVTRLSEDAVQIRLSGQLLTAAGRDVPLALLTATEEDDLTAVEVRAGVQPVVLVDPRDRPVRRPLRRDDVAVYAPGEVD
ncbi:hypothetical protein BH24ACT10_BH24ACT10_09750 [soil metagenome]